MKPVHRNRRLGMIGGGAVLLVGAIALTLTALSNSFQYFLTPSDIVDGTHEIEPDRTVRLGGLVMDGTVKRGEGVETRFRVTDGAGEVEVVYSGVLPDLFREGQGIVAEGIILANGHFEARSVLAKHDENYVPKELQHALDNVAGET